MKKLRIYSAKIQDLKIEFIFTIKLNEFEREVLLTLLNPKYNEIINNSNDQVKFKQQITGQTGKNSPKICWNNGSIKISK